MAFDVAFKEEGEVRSWVINATGRGRCAARLWPLRLRLYDVAFTPNTSAPAPPASPPLAAV